MELFRYAGTRSSDLGSFSDKPFECVHNSVTRCLNGLIYYYRLFCESTNHVDGPLSSKGAGPLDHSVIKGWVHVEK